MITDEQIRRLVEKQIFNFLDNLADDDSGLDDLIGEHLPVDVADEVWDPAVERLRTAVKSHRSVYEWAVREPGSLPVAEAKEAN